MLKELDAARRSAMTGLASDHPSSPPLRICHVITTLDTGGAERSLVNLLTGMDRSQFDCEVVSLLEPGPMARPLAEAGIAVTSLGMHRGRASLSRLLSLVRHLRDRKPAILQTWLYHADLIGTVAALIARPERLLWNLRCTDMTVDGKDRRIGWIVRLLALLSGYPDAIIVNSQRGQSDHTAMGYHPKRWINIPNGVDLERFHPRREQQAALRTRLGLQPRATTIGLVARYHPMKDVETFLAAAVLFGRTQRDSQFVLCGEGFTRDNDALADMIAKAGLGERIVLLGRRTDVELVYPALDVLTLCSIYGEGFPNVLCEAMACGVPCVATDVGDSAKIIGECGVIVPKRDPEALAQRWQAVLDRGAQQTGEMARAHVTAHYGLERMRAQYQSLYRSLALNGRASA